MNMEAKAANKNDLIHDSLLKIFAGVGLPVLISSVTSVFMAIINNKTFSVYFPEYFKILAVLSALIGVLSNYSTGVVTAVWSNCSLSFVRRDEKAGNNLVSGLFALFLCQAALIFLLVLTADPVLYALNTPQEIYSDVKNFYVLYLIGSFFMALGLMSVRLVTGLESRLCVLTVNLANICLPALVLYLSLAVFKWGLIGAAVYTGVNGLIISLVSAVILIAGNSFNRLKASDFGINFRFAFSVLKQAFIIGFQDIICTAGYLLVTAQTNKYLSVDYISVLSVTLPVTSVMSVLSTMVAVVIPPNYQAGNYDRTKKIFRLLFIICVACGAVCFLIYMLFGQYYYATLFSDPEIIRMGAEYWFWYGLGLVFISPIYAVRFFFVAVLRTKTALLSGVFELLGNVICAYWLIPSFGNIGRSLSYTIGWALASVYLITAYLILRNRIYADPKQKSSF